MKVTICQLDDASQKFEQDWTGLVVHVHQNSSELVVLPEMPFYPWFAADQKFQAPVWRAAVAAHEHWLKRLGELGETIIIGTCPVQLPEGRRNQSFFWTPADGYEAVHNKRYLPDEPGFWEASWYERGGEEFSIVDIGGVWVGIMVCTELWFLDRARHFGQAGAHLLVTPRATEYRTREKWLVGGQAAAIVSGAYQLSSNRVSLAGSQPRFGGWGWVIDPEGKVLGITTNQQPYLTIEIDLEQAVAAKQTYPRYVKE